MKRVFADAVYWVALAHRKDQCHQKAVEASQGIGSDIIVTTDEVLDEFLTHFSRYGTEFRIRTAKIVRELLTSPSCQVIPQSHDSFLAGLSLYETRSDKEYSLTDCISMAAMRELGITQILTHDLHFAQEGFETLL